MTQSDERAAQPSVQDVALIVGGGPGISSSCARLFAKSGMRVAIAARNPDKPALPSLEKTHGVRRYACGASEPVAVELLFQNVVRDFGADHGARNGDRLSRRSRPFVVLNRIANFQLRSEVAIPETFHYWPVLRPSTG